MDYYIDGDFDNPLKNNSEKKRFYSSSYSSKNSNYIPITIDAEKQKEINYNALDEVVAFYNSNESLFKAFELKTGVDLWFFEHFRIYFTYQTFFLKWACIQVFFEEHPNGLVVSNDPLIQHKIDKNRLHFITDNQKAVEKKKSPLKELIFICKQYTWKGKSKGNNVILSRIEDDIDGKDQRFGELEEICGKLFNRDVFNANKEFPAQLKKYKEVGNVDQLIARYLLSWKSPFALMKFRKQMNVLFQSLAASSNTLNENTSIILDLLKRNKFSYFVYYLKYKAFARFFQKKTCKNILFINENSAQQKAVQYAAAQHNVNVFAIQHGAIYDLHPAYMYGKYNTPPILPTVTFTWGNYFTRLLTNEGGYAKEQVITSGRINPVNIKKRKHKSLQTDKQIIVYATQPQPNNELRVRELKDVFLAAKACEEKYTLVLRPHPAETDDAFFINAGKEVGFESFVIDRESDLKTHFEECTLLITSYSTVGAEFVPYYKPLLVLDYLKADKVNYIKQGVGIPIYDRQNLIEILNKEELKINYKAFDIFVDDYFYKNGEEAVEIIKVELSKFG